MIFLRAQTAGRAYGFCGPSLTWICREGRPGVFAAVVDIRPGTHHVRFLVDGNMCTSPDLPTTVDFGNNLVNYIEVNADDIPAEPLDSGAPVSSPDHNSQQLTEPPTTDKAEAEQTAKHAKSRPVAGLDRYSNEIPQYLTEFDQPEDSPSYQFAVAAIEKLPQPPSLPGFLGKPLLNSAVLIKDDNSVLNMPNHTVLNHLATSSIKNNILALSATTRYRSKVSSICSFLCYCLVSDHTPSTSRPSFTSRQRMAREDLDWC